MVISRLFNNRSFVVDRSRKQPAIVVDPNIYTVEFEYNLQWVAVWILEELLENMVHFFKLDYKFSIA